MVVCSFEDANVSENTLQFIIQVVVKFEKVHREWRKITFNVKHPDFIMFTLFHLFCSGIATQDCSSHKLSQFVSERFKSILNILENNPPRQIAVSSLSHTVAKLRESSLLCTEDSLPNLEDHCWAGPQILYGQTYWVILWRCLMRGFQVLWKA